MMCVYIHDPPLFRQCDVTDNAYVVEDSHLVDHTGAGSDLFQIQTGTTAGGAMVGYVNRWISRHVGWSS